MVVRCQGRAVTNRRLSQDGTLPSLNIIDLGYSALWCRACQEKTEKENENAREFYQIRLPFPK